MKVNITERVKIVEIVDRKTNETKTPHRIGKICTVTYAQGGVAFVNYPNGGYWTTSTIVDFKENVGGILIKTLNTLYRFDYV